MPKINSSGETKEKRSGRSLFSQVVSSRKTLAIAAVVILVTLTLVRFVALDRDPPLSMTGHGQALLTDPYHLTHHARNKALFGEWRSFDNRRWDTFKNSLVSGAAYLVFVVGGVSRISANLAALSLNLIGLGLFIAAIYRLRGATEAFLTAILLLLNNLLFFYGRLPFLENGLIFLAGGAFFALTAHGERPVGQIAGGALVALAALAGKLFGAILFAPAIALIIYRHRQHSLKPLALLAIGAVSAGAIYLMSTYGVALDRAMSYYSEHTVGMYGTPPGFKSVSAFFKMLLTYGGESGLTEYAPFLFLLGLLSITALTLVAPKNLRFHASFAPVVFCVVWFGVGVAGLSPFLYRPLRYGLFLLLPLSALGAAGIGMLIKSRTKLKPFNVWWSLPIVFLSSAYLTTQMLMFLSEKGGRFTAGVGALSTSLTVGVVTCALYWALFARKRSTVTPLAPVAVLGVALALSIGWNVWRISDGLTHSGSQLKNYNTALTEALPPDAVLTGPYAPALTIDNNLRSVIYMFGLADVERDLFKKYPITHMAVDRSNWEKAQGIYPELSGAKFLTALVVRDVTIHLYRISANSDSLTSFEKGMAYLEAGAVDSAEASFRASLAEHPQNILAWMNLISVLPARGAFDEVEDELEKLLAVYPENYQAVGFAYGMYSRMAKRAQNKSLSERAHTLKQKLDQLNPAMPLIVTDG